MYPYIRKFIMLMWHFFALTWKKPTTAIQCIEIFWNPREISRQEFYTFFFIFIMLTCIWYCIYKYWCILTLLYLYNIVSAQCSVQPVVKLVYVSSFCNIWPMGEHNITAHFQFKRRLQNISSGYWSSGSNYLRTNCTQFDSYKHCILVRLHSQLWHS